MKNGKKPAGAQTSSGAALLKYVAERQQVALGACFVDPACQSCFCECATQQAQSQWHLLSA